MSEVTKAVGQWIVSNVGWSVLILLFILSMFFKITQIEVDPLGWLIGWIGKALTKNVRNDIADLKKENEKKFEEVKKDRSSKIQELKEDYESKISGLRKDLDAFEGATNKSIKELKSGTTSNCNMMKKRMDQMEKSNDMQTVRQIKAHVLDFANSCLNKRRHTKQDFDNIIMEDEEYQRLAKKYKLVNGVYKEDFDFIMKCYHKCQDENSFLKESDMEP